MDKINITLSILSHYYDEWKFRHDGLWKRMIQFFVIIFFVSTFPITIQAFNGIVIPTLLPLILFPVTGILLSLFFLLFCLSESSRINAIDIKIKQIIKDISPDYAKMNLPSFGSNKKQPFFVFRWRMAIWVPVFLTSIQVILAVGMIILILVGTSS